MNHMEAFMQESEALGLEVPHVVAASNTAAQDARDELVFILGVGESLGTDGYNLC